MSEDFFRYDSNEFMINSDNSIQSDFNNSSSRKNSAQLTIILKRIKKENNRITENEKVLSRLYEKYKLNENLLAHKNMMNQRKLEFLEIRRKALQRQSHTIQDYARNLDSLEKQVGEELVNCRKRETEMAQKSERVQASIIKLNKKNERYLERVKDKMELGQKLRKIKEQRKDNLLDMIITSSKERREIKDHHDKLLKNSKRLSVLFRTHLEKIEVNEKDNIKDICSRYHLEDRLSYAAMIEQFRGQVKKKKIENMRKLKRIADLDKRLKELRKEKARRERNSSDN